MSRRPMTSEEMRRATAGHHHDYRASFKRPYCALCGRGREHPVHGRKMPPLDCPCGSTVERHEVGAHLRGHGVFACGLDPWKMTDQSLAELLAFVERLKRKPRPEHSTQGAGPGA